MEKVVLKVETKIRGEVQDFNCNIKSDCTMPKPKEPVIVGIIDAITVEKVVANAVDSYCSTSKKSSNKALLDTVNYYTEKRNKLLTYPSCSEDVITQATTDGTHLAETDLKVLKITNKELYKIGVANLRIPLYDALDEIIAGCGYSFDCSVSDLVLAITGDYTTNSIIGVYKDADKLVKLLLFIFDDIIDSNAKNKTKELAYILYNKLNADIILNVKKHVCSVFGLSQVTIKDSKSNKKEIHFIKADTTPLPKSTEVELTFSLKIPNIKAFDSDFNLVDVRTVNYCYYAYSVYAPIKIINSTNLTDCGMMEARGDFM